MKLKKVTIRGFRSIEEMEIHFNGNGHKILVGKNEGGKSNILKALNLLSGKVKFEQADKKVLYSKRALVMFLFELESHEIDKCRVKFTEKFPGGHDAHLTEHLTVKAFFDKHSKYLLYFVEEGKTGQWTHWRLNAEMQIHGNWYSVSQNVESYGLHEKIPPGSYISDASIQDHLNEQEQGMIRNCLSPINLEVVYESLREAKREIVAPDNFIFPIRYWSYDAKDHDLPSSIPREAFCQNPNSCLPLKHMFLLADIEANEIQRKISEANKQGPNQLKSLFDHVNTETNTYIDKSWKEYSNVRIELRSDGEKIAIGIQDTKNTFDFKQRSDGFRRLISFLLLISTELDAGQHPRPHLILIDEPESGLHPSSAKDLKYKLVELGKTHTVIYATHSIAMIDTENIQNNLLVSRNEENTNFEEAKEDGTSPAENVYREIGHSIYEDLKKKNILLEGYTDKQVLRLLTKGNKWKDVGTCYTRGATHIAYVVSILDLASRKYVVLSDEDEGANREKNRMGNPDFWYTYKDLGSEAITIEDFYQKTMFVGIVREILRKYQIEMPASVLSGENNRMASIKRFLLKEHKDLLDEKEKEDNLKGSTGMVKQITEEIKMECARVVGEENVIKGKVRKVLDALLEKIDKSPDI